MKLKRKKRLEAMENSVSPNGCASTGNKNAQKAANATTALERAKRELASMRRKLYADGSGTGRNVVWSTSSFCKWCKRVGRRAYSLHDSKDCFVKFPDLYKNRRRGSERSPGEAPTTAVTVRSLF